MPDLADITDALRAAQKRGELPTALSTAELRELGADVLARSVFTARGTSAIFASKLKEVVDELASGRIGETQARAALKECLIALGYTPEGGFPGDEGKVPPALAGTLQDLSSFRRLDLIVRTQLELMQGAGDQWRGNQPDRLAAFPAWELVRVAERAAPRDWPSRWVIVGGRLTNGRMIALKGDPVWGELGSYFDDALGVDYPPFAFNSGMGWREVSAAVVETLGITGPDGETPEEFFQNKPGTMGGKLPLPTPRMSLDGVDPALVKRFKTATHAVPVQGKPATVDFSDLLARDIAARDAARGKGGRR